jgi:hypothetical protein
VFEVGEKVVSPFGVGEVVGLEREGSFYGYPVAVEFIDQEEDYTLDGKYNLGDKFPTLFKLGEQPKSWKVTKTVRKYRVLHRTFKGIRSLKLSEGYYESVEDYNRQIGGETGISLVVDDQDFEEIEVEL